VITPNATFGPPQVGRGWEVEPAKLDSSWEEGGRFRLVGIVPRQTAWGTVSECEFEVQEGRA
jgi:hypothetical protein